MENERKKRLLESMKKLNKNFKDTFTDFAENEEKSVLIPTGIKTFDKFIGEGFKSGNFTVLWGGESVGKSTLALQTIANAQKEGKIACYLDMERSFDTIRAKQLGVNLTDLVLVSKCQTAEEALEIIRAFSKDKVVDLIVLDSIQSMSPKNEQENKGKERELASKEIAELARTLSKFFRVVAPDVYRAQIVCLLIGQVRIAGIGSFYVHADLSGGLALRHWAYQNVFIRRGQGNDAPVEKYKEYFIDPDGNVRYATKKSQIGFDSVLKLCKTKSCKSMTEGSEIHLPFLFSTGFVDEVVQTKDIPIKIDAKDEKEKKLIEDYLIKNKLEEAKQLGLIAYGKDSIHCDGKADKDWKDIPNEKSAFNPLTGGYQPHSIDNEKGKIKPPKGGTGEVSKDKSKKKRGRPRKEK